MSTNKKSGQVEMLREWFRELLKDAETLATSNTDAFLILRMPRTAVMPRAEISHLKNCKRDLLRILVRTDSGTVDEVLRMLDARGQARYQYLQAMSLSITK